MLLCCPSSKTKEGRRWRVAFFSTQLLCFFPSIATPAQLPNFVLMLADDMGYGDLGVNNLNIASETPHLDDLAATGMNFFDMHSGASVCTPARATLLTGRLPQRMGMVSNFGEASLFGLNREEITIAELLKQGGVNYDTAMVGKWHLGHTDPFQPRSRGFDSWLGIPYSWDMGCADGINGVDWFDNFCSAATFRLGCPRFWWEAESDPQCGGAAAGQPGVPLMKNFEIVEQPANLSTVTSRLDEEAVAFIRAHQPDLGDNFVSASTPKPFFLYFAMPHMHAPMAHSPAFAGSSTSRTVYGDTLREMDNSVGRIIAALGEKGGALRNNTLVIFTSDNGPWNIKGDWSLQGARGNLACVAASGNELPNARTVGGLAGSQGIFTGTWQTRDIAMGGGGGGGTGKFTTWEGGHRVPAIFSWPGHIVAGSSAGISPHYYNSSPSDSSTLSDQQVPSNSVLASHLDILPTVLALAGVPLPSDRAFDGEDLAPVLYMDSFTTTAHGAKGSQHFQRATLLHPGDIGQSIQAVRVMSRYKVFFSTCAAAACGELYVECGNRGNATLVFDLLRDPGETKPLDTKSKVAKEATALALHELNSYNKSLESGLLTSTSFAYGSGPTSWVCADAAQISCRFRA